MHSTASESGFSGHYVVLVDAAGESASTHSLVLRWRSHIVSIDVGEHFMNLMRQWSFCVFEHMHGRFSIIVERENAMSKASAEHHSEVRTFVDTPEFEFFEEVWHPAKKFV